MFAASVPLAKEQDPVGNRIRREEQRGEYVGTASASRSMSESTGGNEPGGLSTRTKGDWKMAAVIGSKIESWSHSDGYRVFAPVRRTAARERSGKACSSLSEG